MQLGHSMLATLVRAHAHPGTLPPEPQRHTKHGHAAKKVYKVTVQTRGGEKTFSCRSDELIATKAREAGLDVQTECRSDARGGGCGRCASRQVAGPPVSMVDRGVLRDYQIGLGMVALCQAKPTGDCKLIADVNNQALW